MSVSLPMNQPRRWASTVAKAASVAMTLMGGLVLIGWALGIVALVELFPALTAMNPITALLFILLGVGLSQIAWKKPSAAEGKDAARWVLGSIVALMGVLRLVDYAGLLHLHIDQLLFASRVNALETYPQNEIAPNSAVGFVLCGLALSFSDFETRRRFRPAQVSVLVAGVIALFALVGYTYRVLYFYRFGGALPMSLDSAVEFALFCIGFLAARPDRGLMGVITSGTTGGAVARRLLPMAICIPWILGAVLLYGEHSGYYRQELALAIFAALSIVIFAGLIWWNAQLLYLVDMERERADRRMAVQHRATRVLADASGLVEGVEQVLRAICETLGWQVGVLWLRHPGEERLRWAGAWSAPGALVEEFVESGRELSFGRGEAFPGQVWERDRPVWVTQAAWLGEPRRGESAARAGLRSAIGFPVRAGELPGIMEFFATAEETPDPALLEILGGIGSQAGLFIERARAEEQLRRATANLERSNADLQQFAYVASHDLIEPLRMVTSYLQLVTERYDGALDDQGREFIHFAVDGAQRMRALIHDLLDYSRVEVRGASLEAIESEEAFGAALSNLKIAIEESGAEVSHKALPRVCGDNAQLTRVFQNLIGNGLKFRGAERPRIEAGASRSDAHWVFFVRDNGIGIDPKEFERIFVIFQRLHTRREYPGTGMGLAICKRIVERHGGRMWVESTPGKGSTFFFSLRATNEPAPEAPQHPRTSIG